MAKEEPSYTMLFSLGLLLFFSPASHLQGDPKIDGCFCYQVWRPSRILKLIVSVLGCGTHSLGGSGWGANICPRLLGSWIPKGLQV